VSWASFQPNMDGVLWCVRTPCLSLVVRIHRLAPPCTSACSGSLSPRIPKTLASSSHLLLLFPLSLRYEMRCCCGSGMWASKQRLHRRQRHANAETTLIKASWPTTLSVQVQVQALPVSQSASARSRGGEPIPARYQDRLIGRCHPSSNSEPEIVNSPAVCQLTVLLSLAGLAESRRWSTARSQDPESARDTGSPAA
jgi:hypothetical protein